MGCLPLDRIGSRRGQARRSQFELARVATIWKSQRCRHQIHAVPLPMSTSVFGVD